MTTSLPPIDLDQLDPGIRATVQWLRSLGFDTRDSGDGVTKFMGPEPLPEGILEFPHVFIIVEPERCISEARRLQGCLLELGVEPKPNRIETSYDPATGTAVIMLLGWSIPE